jgi:hypothetical protein
MRPGPPAVAGEAAAAAVIYAMVLGADRIDAAPSP